MITYWFSREDGTTENQIAPVKIGVTNVVGGELSPCIWGLHSCPTPFDALADARGPLLWKMKISPEYVTRGKPVDKYCSRSRRPLAVIDATRIMRRFSALQALTVIDLWNPPEVVLAYLNDESKGIDRSDIRGDAHFAAIGSTWAVVAKDAAKNVAWDAARAIARATARATCAYVARNQFDSLCYAALK